MKRTGIVYRDIGLLQERAYISGIKQFTGPGYHTNALIPATDTIRSIQRDELEPFLATDETPHAGGTELVPISGALDYIKQVGKTEGLRYPARSLTVMTDGEGGSKTGIGLGNQTPTARREKGVRSLSLNTGSGDHFLLVGSVDIFDIAAAARIPEDTVPTAEHIAEYSMGGAVDTMRCLWLRLRAGEAYVAPTQNMLYDGSTFMQDRESVALVWTDTFERGQFGSIV